MVGEKFNEDGPTRLAKKQVYAKLSIDYSGQASVPEGYTLKRVANPNDPEMRVRLQIYKSEDNSNSEKYVGTCIQDYDPKKQKYKLTFEISSEDPELLKHVQEQKKMLDARGKQE